MNILLTAILSVNLTILVIFLLIFLKIRTVYTQFIDFLTPESENKPSKLALTCEALSEMMGRSVVASLKTFLLGAKSGEVRADMAETGAQIDASPLGAFVGMLPKSVKKSLVKNPQLLDLAIGFMQRNSGGAPGSNHNHSEPSAQVRFKL